MVSYIENSGDNLLKAIKILGAANRLIGEQAEYHYLVKQYGVQNRDWQLVFWSREVYYEGKYYDFVKIRLPSGHEKMVTFDISDFYKEYPS